MASTLALAPVATNSDNHHFDHEVDARGLSCPLPMLSTRKSVDSLNQGEVLKVVSTDSGAVSFFQSLSRQTGLELLSWHKQDGEFRFFLRKP